MIKRREGKREEDRECIGEELSRRKKLPLRDDDDDDDDDHARARSGRQKFALTILAVRRGFTVSRFMSFALARWIL